MKKSTIHISKMDCPSEENLIRMKLDGHSFNKLEFDVPNRNLYVYHEGFVTSIFNAITDLGLGASLIGSEEIDFIFAKEEHSQEKKLLYTVLIINFSLFVLEITTGFISRSMGLVSDSLDMLADAVVYGLSLYAVGHPVAKKKRVAKISGYFQLTLALFGIIEVIRRFFEIAEIPVFQTMILISLFALAGNAVSLYLLQKSKSKELNIQASMIFTGNDVIINAGVISAALLVYYTNSKYPDLIVGAIVFLIVIKGSLRILKLAE